MQIEKNLILVTLICCRLVTNGKPSDRCKMIKGFQKRCNFSYCSPSVSITSSSFSKGSQKSIWRIMGADINS